MYIYIHTLSKFVQSTNETLELNEHSNIGKFTLVTTTSCDKAKSLALSQMRVRPPNSNFVADGEALPSEVSSFPNTRAINGIHSICQRFLFDWS